MRSTVLILCRAVVAATLVFGPATAVLGQDSTEIRREWGKLANGRTEFEVSDAASLPGTLARAAEESGCRYKEDIKDAPVRFRRLGSRRVAIVFCSGISGSHQVFDVWNVLKPRLIEFPFLAQPSGFRSTAQPGWITWETGAEVFHAETGSDASPAKVRHIYRMDNGSFVLVRVEFNPHVGNKDGWATIWDAPTWSFPTGPN